MGTTNFDAVAATTFTGDVTGDVTGDHIPPAITDPGDAGAIPVTSGGSCALVTAGAETRTLAAPTYVGQLITLYLKTDGGDCVLTCATAVNQTGNTSLTFADAGDEITLRAIESGANKRWRVVSNDGVALA
jgi:hypothetical protein